MNLPNIVATIDATFENTLSLDATPTPSVQEISADLGTIYQSGGGGECKVLYNTTAYWNSRPDLVAKRGYLYVYSDYKEVDNQLIAGIKAGDGTSYLIDMPFIDKPLDAHIADTVKHITAEERQFWNDKVRCFIDPNDEQNIVFTTN